MSKRKQFANLLVVLGTLALLGAAVLWLYNLNRNWDANNASFEVLEQMDLAAEEDLDETAEDFPDDMDSVTVDGVEYIGTITVPYLEIELPVSKVWSYDNLKSSPCRYQGNVNDNNLVICGHNYVKHFGRLSRLHVGASVQFKDVHGSVTEYTVTALETLAPTAIEEMTISDADLTLFTCTYDGRSRYTVRCSKKVN